MVFLKDILKDWRVWVILVAGLIFWLLSSCSTPEQMVPGLKEYRVGQNRHDFTPSPFPVPGEARSFDGVAYFDPSCWYNSLGVDNADWNKLAGVYKYSDLVKNRNAFILAWRPDTKIEGMFELCMYENIQGKNVPKESAIYKVRANERFTFALDEINGKYSLYVNNTLLGTQQNGHTYKVIGKISAWFGGNRTAPRTMWLYMNF
jgi:hypothetical protein